MKTISLKHMVGSLPSPKKKNMIVNVNAIINSLFGFLLALTFNDIKDTIVENILLKVIHANIKEEKTKVKFLKAEIDLLSLLDMFIRMIIILFFVFLAYRTSKKFND